MPSSPLIDLKLRLQEAVTCWDHSACDSHSVTPVCGPPNPLCGLSMAGHGLCPFAFDFLWEARRCDRLCDDISKVLVILFCNFNTFLVDVLKTARLLKIVIFFFQRNVIFPYPFLLTFLLLILLVSLFSPFHFSLLLSPSILFFSSTNPELEFIQFIKMYSLTLFLITLKIFKVTKL